MEPLEWIALGSLAVNAMKVAQKGGEKSSSPARSPARPSQSPTKRRAKEATVTYKKNGDKVVHLKY